MAASSTGARLPLLDEEKEYHEGCSACLLERRKITESGAPKKELAFIAFVVLANALPISSLYPFVYFMVRDFGIANSDTRISTYAGYIGSALMFGRSLTAVFWGMLADRYGRTPVMTFGTASIILFNTTFGFSTNFWMALMSRILLGMLNGMQGPVRAYASEICSQEHQPLGLSMVGTMWGVGLIIGPAIGGYLAQPADKYPTLFPTGSLFYRFPYALPCLCISAFAVAGLALSLWLPESLHNHKGVPNISQGKPEEVSVSKSNDVKEARNCSIVVVAKGEAQPMNKPSLRKWGMVAAISVFCIYSLHDMAYSEIFSLWAVSPEDYGGLGFTTSELGTVLAVSGAALLVFQLLVFAPLANRFGAIQVIRVPTVLTLPLVAIYPLISRLGGVSLWIVLISVSVIKNILTACIITGCFIIINNSVGIKQRGFINGISMTFVSLSRAIGPAAAGALFSWAQERMDASFLPGTWVVFFALNIIVLITLCITFEPILPKSLLYPLPEESETLESKKDEKLERASSFTFD